MFAQPLQDTRICIDAGHGGHTGDDRQIFLPYGIVYWESEGDFITSLHLKEMLEELGADVVLTRTDNSDASDISLSERAAIANEFNADYFHSIHTNGGGGNYSVVFYKEVNGQAAFPFALEMSEIMAPNLEDLMKTEANYVKGDYSFLGFNLGVLRYANMPSTLSESSFHDVPEEGLRLKNESYLENYAWAMAKSFLAYFEVGGFETGRVGGVVKDITSDEVINEIQVTCTPSGQSYSGDLNYNGFYAFGDLDPGSYELELSKEGFLNKIYQIQIQANQYLDLDLTIQYFNNGYPNLDFYVEGLPAGAGESLTFNAEKSTDDGNIEVFSWDFGDASPLDTGMIVTHKFYQDTTYTVSLTATDNEGKQSSIQRKVTILSHPPSIPHLYSLHSNNNQHNLEIKWKANPESNILKYHIYYSEDKGQNWQLFQTVDGAVDSYHSTDFNISEKTFYFSIKAENIVNQFSDFSDTYGFYNAIEIDEAQNVLIVNGFNRRSSYTGDQHDFVVNYLEAIQSRPKLNISSCSNHAIIQKLIELEGFDMVFWFLGDESTAHETFGSNEQSQVKEYLEGGGKLFVSGAEIAWDLVAKGSPSDKTFYQDYLKAEYLADGGAGRSPASGISGSGFQGSLLYFGQVYNEDFPDEIGPFGGSEQILKYVTNASAGIKYKGSFGNSDKTGAVVNIGFPLESVEEQSKIDFFIGKVIDFFNSIPSTIISTHRDDKDFNIFPIPASKELQIYSSLNESQKTHFKVLDVRGKTMLKVNRQIPSGKVNSTLDISFLKSGIYYLFIESGKQSETHKLVIVNDL